MRLPVHMITRLRFGALMALFLAWPIGAAPLSPDQMNLGAGATVPTRTGTWDDPASFPEAPEGTFDFPSSGSTIVGSTGFIDAEQVGYFWSVTRGDSVVEAFAGPSSISSYALHVDVLDNALNSGAFVNWNVIINGVTVDNFSVDEGFLGTVNRFASFPAIAGPGYNVELRVTNEVASGQGSHTFRYAGNGNNRIEFNVAGSSLLAIPTISPVGLALFVLLLAAVGFRLLRRQRST